jgi:hypothetical protein
MVLGTFTLSYCMTEEVLPNTLKTYRLLDTYHDKCYLVWFTMNTTRIWDFRCILSHSYAAVEPLVTMTLPSNLAILSL